MGKDVSSKDEEKLFNTTKTWPTNTLNTASNQASKKWHRQQKIWLKIRLKVRLKRLPQTITVSIQENRPPHKYLKHQYKQ